MTELVSRVHKLPQSPNIAACREHGARTGHKPMTESRRKIVVRRVVTRRRIIAAQERRIAELPALDREINVPKACSPPTGQLGTSSGKS